MLLYIQTILKRYFIKIVVIVILLIIFSNYSNAQCDGGPCSLCKVEVNIISSDNINIINGISIISGVIQLGNEKLGSTIEIEALECGKLSIELEISYEWNKNLSGENNWIHGISFEASGGWVSAKTEVPVGWIWQDTITGDCSGNRYTDGGYYHDGTDNYSSECSLGGSLNDSIPANNHGIRCESNCPPFKFKLEYCPLGIGAADEFVKFVFTDDGETGAWKDYNGCVFTAKIPMKIRSVGIQLPEDVGPICQGDSIELNAGEGCDSYLWSTGDTTNIITVAPLNNQSYGITVGDGTCQIEGEVLVSVDYCCVADAGEIAVTYSNQCPGQIREIAINNNQQDLTYNTKIIIVDADSLIVEVFDTNYIEYINNNCGVFQLYSYNYLEVVSAYLPTIGDSINLLHCETDIICCDYKSVSFNYIDTIAPVYLYHPPDTTISCAFNLPTYPEVQWTDNCGLEGYIISIDSLNYDLCNGGYTIRTWKITDACGNYSVVNQYITIEPIEEAQFINPPADTIMSCDEFQFFEQEDLSYSNNSIENCLIFGSISSVIVGEIDVCGSDVIYLWEFTDNCGKTISHYQKISIEPAINIYFLSPPIDDTISCSESLDYTPQDLNYSNEETENCLISGSVSPIIEGTYESCDGFLNITWSYTDSCGYAINHSQIIYITPAPIASFTNLPNDTTIACYQYELFEAEILTYSNNATGTCLIQDTIHPKRFEAIDQFCEKLINYTWEFIDECGRIITHSQELKVSPFEEVQFTYYPSDTTIDCSERDSFLPMTIAYTNNETDLNNCLASGSIIPSLFESIDTCKTELIYTWEFTDLCNRSISHSQIVTIGPPPKLIFSNIEIEIPSIFNPNSNIGNNLFTLYSNKALPIKFDMFIYDRWGNLIFSANNLQPNQPETGWDGTFNGLLVESGVYVYLYKVQIIDGKMKDFIGTITMIR